MTQILDFSFHCTSNTTSINTTIQCIKFSSLKYTEQYSSFEWNGIRVFGVATTYCIICIYRKQEVSMLIFLDDLSDLLTSICSFSTDEILVVGDFNVHFGRADKPSCDLSSLLSEYGLTQQVNECT